MLAPIARQNGGGPATPRSGRKGAEGQTKAYFCSALKMAKIAYYPTFHVRHPALVLRPQKPCPFLKESWGKTTTLSNEFLNTKWGNYEAYSYRYRAHGRSERRSGTRARRARGSAKTDDRDGPGQHFGRRKGPIYAGYGYVQRPGRCDQ